MSSRLFLPSTLVFSFAAFLMAAPPPTAAEGVSENVSSPGRQAARELRVVARIGDEVITLDDFQAEVQRRAADLPRIVATAEGRRQLLDEMVRQRALATSARRAGYDRHPEVVEVFERMMVTQFSRDQIHSRLRKIEVSDAEILDFYRSREKNYTRPGRFQGAVVFMAKPSSASPEALDALASRVDQALKEAGRLDPGIRHFGEVARRYSDDRASRYRGGVIGWLSPRHGGSRWPESVRSALFALDWPGSLASPVETEDGFYLVRLVAKEEGGVLPFEEVADGIRQRLLRQHKEEIRSTFYSELYADLSVRIDPALLEDSPWPEGPAAGEPSAPPMPSMDRAVGSPQGAGDE